MASTYKLFCSVVLILTTVKVSQSQTCLSTCPNSKGYIENCVLNKPEHVLEEKQVVSQLQCFDYCERNPKCTIYNYNKNKHLSCQLLGGIWSFDDEKALVQQNMSVFAWLNRDQYLTVSNTEFNSKTLSEGYVCTCTLYIDPKKASFQSVQK